MFQYKREIKIKKMTNLIGKIQKWVSDRNLETQDPRIQMCKTVEELGELANAINKGNKADAMDGIGAVRASVCGYCGRLLGDDNYPKPIIQGIDFEIPENAEKVEGSCCIARERLGSF